MSRKLYTLFSVLLIASFALAACGAPATSRRPQHSLRPQQPNRLLPQKRLLLRRLLPRKHRRKSHHPVVAHLHRRRAQGTLAEDGR